MAISRSYPEYGAGIAPNVDEAVKAVKEYQAANPISPDGRRSAKGLSHFNMEPIGNAIYWNVPTDTQHYFNGKRDRLAR